MKTLVLLALLGLVRSEVVDISCSDNATCIENIPRTLVRSIRQRKTVRLFDTFTIEPLNRQAARGNLDPLSRLVMNHAISFDWEDFTFRFSAPEGRSDALDLEVLESRTVKDVSEAVPKKSKKEDEEVVDDKSKKIQIRRRRRVKRKVFQALVPLLFGMKSTGIVIFGLGMVTVITLKAFMASKLALIVTVGMALKKLYESYGSGYGLQNPYLYSQYPIDFPSASSHAYSISGVSPQFASPEMYSPTGLATHANEMLQSHDASAQQSQQAPTVLNSTRAAERWDGYRRRPMFYGSSRATSDSYSAYRNHR
ncbi:uncharacterized protein LOC121737870 [Aricia agestis]|uniref:uncharacterized protein LOC121737870 n=1 Tax=Aricia agestis TaxID=91739 RepID=UPI001C205564|nr:uncharacterized protein LOC121737870 [Aricia agestis]